MGERGEKEGGAGGGSAGNRVLFFTVAKSILGIFRQIMEGTTTRRASKMDFNGTQQRRDVKSLLPSIISPNTREPPVTLSSGDDKMAAADTFRDCNNIRMSRDCKTTAQCNANRGTNRAPSRSRSVVCTPVQGHPRHRLFLKKNGL